MDRISALPDKVIHHILGFVPTKCAVTTCVLSKKWMYAWVNAPALDFTDLASLNSDGTLSKEQSVALKNIINRVLLLNCAPCLERVCFEFYKGLSSLTALEWIRVLARRNMKELYQSSNVDSTIELPSNLLLAKKELDVLMLEGLHFQDFADFSINLPRLRILSLSTIEFRNVQDPFSTILSGCPVLEELNVYCCKGIANIQSFSLKKLRIVDGVRKLVIKTPNLEILWLSIYFNYSVIEDLPSLLEVRLDDVWTSTDAWIDLLQKIHCTQTLVLNNITLDVPQKNKKNMQDYDATSQLLTFERLAHFEVSYSPWPIVLQILENAPNLTSFVIRKLMYDWPDIAPTASKELSLERIECHCFDEVDEGYELIRYLLSSSKGLKELKIYLRRWLHSESENEILKSLLKLPRASPQCQIIIVKNYEKSEITIVKEDESSSSAPEENDYESDWVSESSTSCSSYE